MLRIDLAILDTNKNICKNIDRFDESERGLISQNILAQLRNFVEYIAGKVYANGADVDPNDYNTNVAALTYLQTRGNLRFLIKFHELLQKSVSHYTIDEGGSERLMLKYYEYLLKIKIFLKDTYNLDVLENIEDFPLNNDIELADYYEKISEKIFHPSYNRTYSNYNDRYYIQKIKPFFVNQQIFYEITFTVANNKASKFDRLIAFTRLDISDNYAVKLSIHNDNIQIIGKTMSIQIIDNWSVSIRPCELDNFADIICKHHKINGSTIEYQEIMKFLTETKMSLTELIMSSEEYFQSIKLAITTRSKVTHFINILDQCRELVMKDSSGSNIIRYLLHKLNNKVIKWQFWREPCNMLSNLYLGYGCIPFDRMPYNTSLIKHNPRIYDLLECISVNGREHELFARYIKNNTEIEGMLFTPIRDIQGFENIEILMEKYNRGLYYKHMHRRLEIFSNQIYTKGYADDSDFIVEKLKELSSIGIGQYTSSVDSWLQQSSYDIDCEEKKTALREMFSTSKVALIYGSAGTGKSTLINHISNFFADKKKIYLANTNPAVDNMRRKVKTGNSNYKTIASFISNKNIDTECDILFIDECSTLGNSDMREVLAKANFKLLVLVGDIFQIESISFGNWFSIARSFVPKESIFELTKPYRSTDNNLLLVWDRVRNLDIAILEPLVKNNYSTKLDESIFDHAEGDQIVLCLNYDGLYGINNINRFLQNSNPNPSVQWSTNIYKIGDPILFNETERFTPLIYNNMKGQISKIDIEENQIWFNIELDISINGLDALGYDFELIGQSLDGNSIIRFSVNKYRSTDEDDDSSDVVVPFQIAYAVSIHKAQGLEYNSVKIVITNETEERITHNIFYTAITRARQKLKIYWSPETENKILGGMILLNNNKDVNLLKAKYSHLTS
ncbi:ATP-dependent DNA helicase [Clostridium akagii]|uniref:ATP-dependent DNA helicase n=1 Tax=Clostridium akagii TaxID=91623 RepID=UPI00047EA81D|nr:ATP-dependent RecD-like DNA helicase [Clostridium akagii]